jgi:hypothetical protein
MDYSAIPRNCVGCDEEQGSLHIQSSFLTTKMFIEVTGIERKII